MLTKSSGGVIRQYISLSKSLNYDNSYKPSYGRVTIRGNLWKGFYSDMMNVAKEGDTDFKNGKKPVRLIKQLIYWYAVKYNNDLILDFFAGSATTAHAVMKLNAEDGGDRKFILVQLPEKCDEKSEAFKAKYKTIAEISKERIRRAGKKIKEENPETTKDLDIGFRVLKVDSSNMKDTYYKPKEINQQQIAGLISNIKEDRTDEDLLFQVMLDSGVQLDLEITTEEIMGKKVYFVAANSLCACFETNLPEGLFSELAKREPVTLVLKDSSFVNNDALKTNVEQIFRQLSPETELKVI